jgi:hypothetical protein
MRIRSVLCFVALSSIATAMPLSSAGEAAARSNGLPTALLAAAPDPKLRDALGLFGQFVGSWDVAIVNHLPDGTTQTVKGEWHFGWILGGAAVQDVWMAPTSAQRAAGEPLIGYGTTLRFYDPKIDAWRILWASASYRNTILFTARRRGSEIVMDGDAVQPPMRWIFSDITPQSFRWRAVQSKDAWVTSEIQQEMTATRVDHRDRLSEILFADGAARGFESENSLFGQLVGDWTIGWEGFRADGSIVETDGSLHVGWVLDGRIVQDVWRFRKPNGEFVAGTTLRVYDPRIAAWHSVWFYPAGDVIQTFVARQTSEGILLDGTTPTGLPEQWIFSKMTPGSFDWRAIESADNRTTWRVTEHMRIRRVSGSQTARSCGVRSDITRGAR